MATIQVEENILVKILTEIRQLRRLVAEKKPKQEGKRMVRIGVVIKETGLTRHQIRIRRNTHDALAVKQNTGHYLYDIELLKQLEAA